MNLDKIILFLQVFPLIIVLFVLPGYLFRMLLFGKSNVFKPVLGLDFSIGYSLLIIPSLISYYNRLSWNEFYIIYSIIVFFVVLLTIFYKEKVLPDLSKQKRQIKYLIKNIDFWYCLILLSITFIVLFLKGGHFIGDHQHHLAYIQKLVHRDIITPYSPMYKGVEFIPYNYAYNINFIFNAFLCRITKCDINYFWDISPALFFIFSISSYKFLYQKFLPEETYKLPVYTIFFVIIIIVQTFPPFKPALDYELMPIPDQFSRNIFLPLLFTFLFDVSKKTDVGHYLMKNKLLSFLIMAAIIFSHLLSYLTITVVGLIYVLLFTFFHNDRKQKFNRISLYISIMIFSLIILLLRLKNSTFYLYDENIYLIINKYFLLIQCFLLLLLVMWILLEKTVEKTFFKIDVILKKNWYYIIFSGIVIGFFFLVNKYTIYLKNTISDKGKYGEFIHHTTLNAGFFVAAVICLVLVVLFIKQEENENEEKLLNLNTILFFIAVLLSIVLMYIKPVNIILSKFFSQAYTRRFVFMNQHYFDYIYSIFVTILLIFFFKRIKNRIVKKLVINIIMIIVIFVTGVYLFEIRLKDVNTYNREYVMREKNVFAYIRENIEPWTVIASYKYSAMDIVAQTPNYFLASETVHSPSFADERQRQTDEYKLFTFKNIEKAKEIIREYEIEYILTEYNNSDVYAPSFSLEDFNNNVQKYPEYFKKVYSDEKYIFYKINDTD